MTTYDLLKRRVSIRKFNDKEISNDDLDKILSAAIAAPSAGNMIPYSILTIKNPGTLEKLSKSCDDQAFIKTAKVALVFLVDHYKWSQYFINNDIKAYCRNKGLTYEGPTLADAILGMQDALIASENAVIAAEDLGIGSCYIGDILEEFEYHKELFDLPDHVFPATMLVLGHYDYQPKPRYRFNQEYVVFEETYKKLDQDELEDMFSEKTKLYKPDRSPDTKNFAQQFYERKMGAPFFKEMNRSIDLILKMFQRP